MFLTAIFILWVAFSRFHQNEFELQNQRSCKLHLECKYAL